MEKNLSVLVYKRQHGVTLVVALVMLLIMTSLGVTTMTGSTLQERMAGNSRQQYIARLNAEFGLRQAEAQLALQNLHTITDSGLATQINGNAGWYAPVNGLPFAASFSGLDLDESSSWENNLGSSIAADANDADSPRYIIEYLGRNYSALQQTTNLGQAAGGSANTPPPPIFRITAIGWGNANAFSVLQSYYIP